MKVKLRFSFSEAHLCGIRGLKIFDAEKKF